MTSLDSVRKLPRCVGVTYRDITAPGESYRPPLPAIGKAAVFQIRLGPLPDSHWVCEVLIGLAVVPGVTTPAPSVRVNGILCDFLKADAAKDLRLISFRVPTSALKKTPTHEVEVVSSDQGSLTIQRVEMFLRPPGNAKTETKQP